MTGVRAVNWMIAVAKEIISEHQMSPFSAACPSIKKLDITTQPQMNFCENIQTLTMTNIDNNGLPWTGRVCPCHIHDFVGIPLHSQPMVGPVIIPPADLVVICDGCVTVEESNVCDRVSGVTICNAFYRVCLSVYCQRLKFAMIPIRGGI